MVTAEEARKLTDPRAKAREEAAIKGQMTLVETVIQTSIEEGRYYAVVNTPLHLEVKKHFRNLGYIIEGVGPYTGPGIQQLKYEIRW